MFPENYKKIWVIPLTPTIHNELYIQILVVHMCTTNYIDSNICHGISLKKPSGNVGTRTCVAGIRSQQKCYALDHHASPKKDDTIVVLIITKIASVMMWELTLDEWEKTVLLNSWLDASFFGDVWWSRA